MISEVVELGGCRCVVASGEALAIAHAEDARALVEAALNEGAPVVVVRAEQLDSSFYQLRTGLAGDVLQKMANYRLTFAVVGDVSEFVAASDSFRDLVVETERGGNVIFAPDFDALAERLGQTRRSADAQRL